LPEVTDIPDEDALMEGLLANAAVTTRGVGREPEDTVTIAVPVLLVVTD